jgi:hypothetical protein
LVLTFPEFLQAMMLDGFGGDDFDAFDWRLRTHRRMQRREHMEQELQRHALERDDEQRVALRRTMLQQLTANLAGVSQDEAPGGIGSLSAEEAKILKSPQHGDFMKRIYTGTDM